MTSGAQRHAGRDVRPRAPLSHVVLERLGIVDPNAQRAPGPNHDVRRLAQRDEGFGVVDAARHRLFGVDRATRALGLELAWRFALSRLDRKARRPRARSLGWKRAQ